MVDKAITYLRGIVKDLLVTVGKFTFTYDFVVLDMKDDEDLSIILGIPLLCTSHDLEDIHHSKLIVQVGSEHITCEVNPKSKLSRVNKDEVSFKDEMV